MADGISPNRPPLGVGSPGVRSSGFIGMTLLIISEAAIFAYLFFAYFYFSVQPHPPGVWPPSGMVPPSFQYSAPQAAIMLAGGATVWWANRSAARGERMTVLLGLLASFILALGFIALQFLDGIILLPNCAIDLSRIGRKRCHLVRGFLRRGARFACPPSLGCGPASMMARIAVSASRGKSDALSRFFAGRDVLGRCVRAIPIIPVS